MNPKPAAVWVICVTALLSTAAAPAPGPCEQLRQACEAAGFHQGGAPEGVGLLADCVNPILKGRAQRPKATKPLPQVPAAVVDACRQAQPGAATGAAPPATAAAAPPSSGTASLAVDASIASAAPRLLPDRTGARTRRIAQVADASGRQSSIVEDELLVSGSAEEAAQIAARYHGTVVSSTAPPPPPAGLPATGRTPGKPVILYLVKIDPSSVKATDFAQHAAKLAVHDQLRASSQRAAQLITAAMAERVAGHRVGPNFAGQSHGSYLYSTAELNNTNAFSWGEFAGVSKAWQFLQAVGWVTGAPRVAIVDGGFYLDNNGNAIPDGSGKSDLPRHPIQWNFINWTPNANGENAGDCGNGVKCPWHGTAVASIATGTVNNGAGAAGSGGQVSVPVLFKYDITDHGMVSAINTLADPGWSIDIANISSGVDCGNSWCQQYHDYLHYYDAFLNALHQGVLIVASAGNESKAISDAGFEPCILHWKAGTFPGFGYAPLCVGALNTGTQTAASFSNYGSEAYFAPGTGLHSMPDGSSGGKLVTSSGTSDAAPLVTGVAAMMKAINPALKGPDLLNLIAQTSTSLGPAGYCQGDNCPNPKVWYVVNPLAAVIAAAGGYRIAPDVHLVTPSSDTSWTIAPLGTTYGFKATAYDIKDGALSGSAVVWTSSMDGQMGTGTSIGFDFAKASAGTRTITVTAKNSSGLSASASIQFTLQVSEVPPSPVITWPPNNAQVAAGTYWLTGYAHSTDLGALGNYACSSLIFGDYSGNSANAEPVPNDTNGLCRAQWTWPWPFNSPRGDGHAFVTLTATNQYGQKGTAEAVVAIVAPAATVQISSPQTSQNVITLTSGGSGFPLSGTATGLPAGASATYTWYVENQTWVMPVHTFMPELTITPVGGFSNRQQIGTGTDLVWFPASTGQCSALGTSNVYVELDVSYSYERCSGFQQAITFKGGGSCIPVIDSASAKVPVSVICEAIQ